MLSKTVNTELNLHWTEEKRIHRLIYPSSLWFYHYIRAVVRYEIPGGACTTVVGIICPHDRDRVNCSAKNWRGGGLKPSKPRLRQPCTYEERRNFRPKNGTWAAHCNCLSAGILFWHEAFAPSGFLFLLLLFYITRMFQEFDRWRNIILGLSFTVYYIVFRKFSCRQDILKGF